MKMTNFWQCYWQSEILFKTIAKLYILPFKLCMECVSESSESSKSTFCWSVRSAPLCLPYNFCIKIDAFALSDIPLWGAFEPAFRSSSNAVCAMYALIDWRIGQLSWRRCAFLSAQDVSSSRTPTYGVQHARTGSAIRVALRPTELK